MTVKTRTQHADAATIRQAIREYRIDRITDNIQHNLGIRDAVILAIIDPTVTDTELRPTRRHTPMPRSGTS